VQNGFEFLVEQLVSYTVGDATVACITAAVLLIGVEANSVLAVRALVMGQFTLLILFRLVPGNVACLPECPSWLG